MATTLELDTGDLDTALREQADSVARLNDALTPAALAPTVGDLLGDAVRSAWSGPYAGVLASATQVVTNPAVAVVTGGGGGRLSGGATAADLVLGTEFGGGRRVGQVRAGRRAKAHARRTTNQFPRQTLAATHAVDAHLDDAARLLMDDVQEAITGG